MLAMILCVVMKILEYSSGTIIETHPTFEEDCTRVRPGRHGRACCAVKPRRRSRSRSTDRPNTKGCFQLKPEGRTVHRCETTRRVNGTRGEAKVTSWNQAPKAEFWNTSRNGRCVVIRAVPAQTYARRRYDRRMRNRAKGLPVSGGMAGGTANMTEDMLKVAGALSGPGADCNSNHTNNGENTASYMSNASSQHDIDFIQDNSDYQWFVDYGYRDSLLHHVSVLSGIESGLYDDLAVAEVDMEHFQIRSLLHMLPALCKTDSQTGIDSNRRGEMFASVTGSMMAQFEFESSISPHSSSQGEDSAGSTDATSLCKSELLFSPFKECPLPGTINFSVDSLDSDIMLTCQANKDNYTIAFEGSTTMCSEDSDYQENVESDTASSEGNNWSRCTRVVNPQVAAEKTGTPPSKGSPGGRRLAANMARSDSVFTTWSKLNGTKTEHPLDTQQLSRHPSGNNNTRIENGEEDLAADNARMTDDNTDSTTVKSRSLPNLARQQQLRRSLAHKTNAGSTSVSSVESMCVKLYDVQNHSSPLTSSGASSSSSGGRLVRLFMKQRSGSSITSDCWDSDSCVRSTSSVGRKNRNVNRSAGPICNTVCQSCPGDRDMAALCTEEEKKEVVDASVFEDSLYRDGARSHDQIAEEDVDGPSEQSESVERVSESISKVNTLERDSTLENVRSCDDSSNYSSHHGHIPEGSRGRLSPEGACRCKRFNVNNNNSVENEPDSRRESRGSICSCNSCSCGSGKCAAHRHSGTQVPVPLINRSIQTSCILDVISKTTMLEEKESRGKEKEKEVEKEEHAKEVSEKEVETTEQTTLVSGISFDKVGEDKQSKPVYVYYPNYALPDLGFLREKQQIDLTKVYLKPQKFSSIPVAQEKKLLSKVPACLRQSPANKQKRPFSCNDIEDLRKKGFSHVRDWNSLAMLLPNEYRQYLAEIPEVSEQLDEKALFESHPLFFVSPPKARANPCECTNLSSASSTNTQPSSGYRGSSTLLSDSSSPAPAPNFNPMFVYRYDSVSSEASLNQVDRKKSCQGPPLPKRSISLPSTGKGAKKGAMEAPAPPRPPLPKSILRHPSDDCNPKLRKETNNKRYSIFEMGLTELDTGRRGSLHEPAAVRIRARSRSEDGLGGTTTEEDEGVDASSERYGHNRECCDHANFEEVLRLSDFLHISETGLSEGSADEWDQDKMNKLRVQVSRFLSANGCEVTEECRSNCVGTCYCDRKVVTFNTEIENGKEKLKTPPNSPNMSAAHLNDHRQYQQPPLSDLPIREEDSCDASTASATLLAKSPIDMQQKKELISAVSDAVEKVINHFSSGVTLNECTRLGDSSSSPAVAEVVLSGLCPALYAVLSDGLLPSISSAFGDISNSVWQVVEASAQQGPMTRSLNELVLRLNSEDVFAEGLLKFNAFIFGLLNVHSMDAWMAYLRTRESIIRKHYSPESLLVLSSCGGPQYRALTDRLLAALRPLTLLPFRLDLLFECRQLHQSLQRLSQPAASPSALIRLVRSIQNSVGHIPTTQEEPSFRKNSVGSGVSGDSGEQPTPTLRRVSRGGAARQLRRPRSCVDASDSDRNDPTTIMCKRWSGVQLGSKLSQALDRLMAEDTEEEYTDSIEREARQHRSRPSQQSDNSTSDDQETLVSMENTSDADIETDCSDRKGMSDGSSDGTHRIQRKTALGVGGKFRRLQMKWELLTGSGSESRNGSTRTSPETSPMKSVRPRAPSNSTVASPAASPIKSSSSRSSLTGGASPSGSSTASTSRIPRPITSPVRPPSGIPVLANSSKKLISPTQLPSGLPHATQLKRPASASVRPSRVDQPSIPAPGEHRSPALRPSSLPYSPAAHSQSEKNRKTTPQRRATSASVSRNKQTNKTSKPAQRLVRTVKHQLASDSGHLSFSSGERLVLVLEVDEQWLLCRKGDRMGLVRRSAVVATQDHLAGF